LAGLPVLGLERGEHEARAGGVRLWLLGAERHVKRTVRRRGNRAKVDHFEGACSYLCDCALPFTRSERQASGAVLGNDDRADLEIT
jgi:hypothetical protein